MLEHNILLTIVLHAVPYNILNNIWLCI